MKASIASNTMWALHVPDRTARTAPAREARDKKFEDQVDANRVLDEAERARRVANLRKAYFTTLQLASAKARARSLQAATSKKTTR